MGFGNLEGNFWLGLDNIMMLTNDVNMELYAGMSCFGCPAGAVFAKYSQFSVAPESQLYQLKLSGYEAVSTVSDSLKNHDGRASPHLIRTMTPRHETVPRCIHQDGGLKAALMSISMASTKTKLMVPLQIQLGMA